jgi:predicted ribosomally synthesized peptide with nif11-like leader
MKRQGITAFLDRLTSEDGFRRDIGRALQGRADTAAAMVELAREAGFDFTGQEFDQALDDRYGGRELSDGELARTSGGVTIGASSPRVVHETASGVTIVSASLTGSVWRMGASTRAKCRSPDTPPGGREGVGSSRSRS